MFSCYNFLLQTFLLKKIITNTLYLGLWIISQIIHFFNVLEAKKQNHFTGSFAYHFHFTTNRASADHHVWNYFPAEGCGVSVGVPRCQRFLGGVGVRFLTALGVGVGVRVGLFCQTPTPEVQLDHYPHHTSNLGIPVEMVQFLLKLVLKEIILAVFYDFHWVLVTTKLLTAKLHSLYNKESGFGIWVRNFERSESVLESDILTLNPQPQPVVK